VQGRSVAARKVERILSAADGFGLSATLFLPAEDNGTVVLIAPATAVQRRLYAPLAEFLAHRGCVVLTWDWRGTGGSRPRSLKGFAATMRGWAQSDLAGIIQWAGLSFPHRRLTAIGHSFGGQSFGLAPGAERLAALVTVAAQNGYVGYWPPRNRLGLRLLWHVAVPAVSHAIGYWPGQLLRTGEDLPQGVALEWARWCTSPDYHGELDRYARLRVPMLAYSIDDDWIAPLRAVEALHAAYVNCTIERRHVLPQELYLERVGHFGLLRDAGPTVWIWAEIARWLTQVELPAVRG
jgi:predicted alpha/beta hydrolase